MGERIEIVAAILTASDSRNVEDDVSGRRLRDLLEGIGARVAEHAVVKEDVDLIRQSLETLCGRSDINLVITTGGTGLGPRDNTPEATLAVVEREVPGIAEAMRSETRPMTPTATLSRAVAGTINGTLIINLPGSPKGVEECFAVIAPILHHAVRMTLGDTKH